MNVWNEQAERLAIREFLENWVLWRDAGDWDRFKTIWHEGGRMMATWFQGSADDFIRVSREGFERGVRIVHFLGGISIDLAVPRAISRAKMTINQRAMVEGVECDVVCTGRFYDFLEKRERQWGLVLRQPVGYRHLAWLQVGLGYSVKPDRPGLTGPRVEALYARRAGRQNDRVFGRKPPMDRPPFLGEYGVDCQ